MISFQHLSKILLHQGKTTQISFLKWNCYFANEWFWWENHSLDTLLSRFGFLRLSLHEEK